jgi:NAD(P)-dependent dehydrogenase (short-subunit alcohol dehydrogenase family)
MSIKADPTEFAGKRVLISGGSKGLGRATVDRFLAGGARVITAARVTPEPVDGVEFVQADLTRRRAAKPWPRRRWNVWAASTSSPTWSAARPRRAGALPP